MQDQVDLAAHGWLQGGLEVSEEVRPTTAPFDARVEGEVESQMCISDQQQANSSGSHRFILIEFKLRAKYLKNRQRVFLNASIHRAYCWFDHTHLVSQWQTYRYR